MPTVDEYWDVDGVSLAELGWNCVTLGGRLGVPEMRGADTRYAFVDGDQWRPKSVGPRLLTLRMWVQGVDPLTGQPAADQRLAFNDNWHTLAALFWQPQRQFTLTRRWWRTNPLTGSPQLMTASAAGQYAGGLEPSMTGRTRATFDVTVKLTQGFFYGAEQTVVCDIDTPVIVHNPGDYDAGEHHLVIAFAGPVSGLTTLTNSTPATPVSVTYNGVIDDGDVLTLDTGKRIATTIPGQSSAPYNRVGGISPSGSRRWFELKPGDNTVEFTTTGGTGTAYLRFRAPYL